MLLVGWQEGHPVGKKMGGWWRWVLVSADGVVPSRMVSVSASVNLPLHHEVQKFSSGTGSPGWSRKKGRKTVVLVAVITFHVSHRWLDMYSAYGRLCVCDCLSLATVPHYCTGPDVSCGNGRGCPLVVHCWENLQSVHEFCCCDSIEPNGKRRRVLVLAVCLVNCFNRALMAF